MNFEAIQERIKDAHQKMGVKQLAMCTAVGITPQGYRAGMKEESLKLSTFIKIAAFLKMDVNTLINGYSEVNDRVTLLKKVRDLELKLARIEAVVITK